MQLRISLSIVIALLFLITLGAIGAGWYGQSQITQTLDASALQGVSGQLDSLRYAYLILLAVLVVVALFAFSMVSRQLGRPLQSLVRHIEHLAAGDLTQRIAAPVENELGDAHVALRRLQESLARMVASVRSGVQSIESGSERIRLGNTDLSGRTEQQAAALQQTAASLEQLASTVKQNADNAQQANRMAANASDVAQRGGDAVGEVVATMQAISASSAKISDIVGVIDSIAFQTNILALNAAVEAARAGEQGKGFAVVASEVRALAQRSAQAAKEIKGLIEDSGNKVAEGSNQVERAGATMQDIVTSVAKVTDILGEISAATIEQSTGIDQINRAVSQMDLVVQQNAEVVRDAAQSAAALSEQLGGVSDVLGTFKVPTNMVIDMPVRQLASARDAAPAARQGGQRAVPAPAREALARPASKPAAQKPKALGSDTKAGHKPVAAEKKPAARPAPDDTASLRRPPEAAKGAPAGRQASAEDDWEEF